MLSGMGTASIDVFRMVRIMKQIQDSLNVHRCCSNLFLSTFGGCLRVDGDFLG